MSQGLAEVGGLSCCLGALAKPLELLLGLGAGGQGSIALALDVGELILELANSLGRLPQEGG